MSHVLILTGMHRSATSLIASLFQRAGVHFGAQLLEANSQNPRGFFEDVEFYEFHERVLHARGKAILVERDFHFEPTTQEHARANELLAARAQFGVWGWKDPRTSLFLEFWREKIPNAHFLFVYRHPFDVLLSLMRRNQLRMLGLLEGLEAWYAYNRALADFHTRHPQQTLLCHSYAIIDQIETFNRLLRERFGLELNLGAATRDAQYQANELRRAPLPDSGEKILRRVHADACALYAQLNERADLPDTKDSAQAAASFDACAEMLLTQNETTNARRSLLFGLLSLTAPETLEAFLDEQQKASAQVWDKVYEHAAQREAWRRTAEERARIIQEQQAWAQARMADLEKLEAHPLVRALRRLRQV